MSPVDNLFSNDFVAETPGGAGPIEGVSTSNTAFVDVFRSGPVDTPVRITSFGDFERVFGGIDPRSEASYAIHQFFQNGGAVAWVVRVASDGALPDSADLIGSRTAPKRGLYALDGLDPFAFNLLAIPVAATLPDADMATVNVAALRYCEEMRAFFLLDIPASVGTTGEMSAWLAAHEDLRHPNAAAYFPRLLVPDTANVGRPRNVGASGTMAGVYARTDAMHGVWKAPAGTDASLREATPSVAVGDREGDALNAQGINVLRTFPAYGAVSWGGRTLAGADQQASEWKYIPVRRTALFIEQSLSGGLQWAVFEPNDEPLWAEIRLRVGAFLQQLFRQGAFKGTTPSEAYFVRCGHDTTTREDLASGVVNVVVGFAPLRPAEFVVLSIRQVVGPAPG